MFLLNSHLASYEFTICLTVRLGAVTAANIQHIDKRMFLDIYKNTARPEALTAANIISGFAATGLVPYKSERVLDTLHF